MFIQRILKDKSSVQLLFYIILFNLILSLPGLWVPYFNIDEVTNSIYAKFINLSLLHLNDFIGSTYFLTHYLYALTDYLFGLDHLLPIHLVHAVWKSFTVIGVFLAGREVIDKRAGVMAAFFYVTASYSFMSKDFHTPSAESFSILPAVLSFYFLFKFSNSLKKSQLILSAICLGLATLFKTPIGIALIGSMLFIVLHVKHRLEYLIYYGVFFTVTLGFPALLVTPFGYGFTLYLNELFAINDRYLQVYAHSSDLYLFLKFLIRSFMIAAGMFVSSFFLMNAIRSLFKEQITKKIRDVLIALMVIFMCLLLTVLLGKRVFYHYYVFLLAVVPLLAGIGFSYLIQRVEKKDSELSRLNNFFIKNALWLALIPPFGFAVEGAFNFSTQPPHLEQITKYINDHTSSEEKIYVWGAVPQLYLFSGRLPATTMFWSDLLAGTSPGSPSMEFDRARGQKLGLTEKIAIDFLANPFDGYQKIPIQRDIFQLAESELLEPKELLERIQNRSWKKVFEDFFKNPPALFIDTSPSDIRGFSHYPIDNYELLKSYLSHFYVLETEVQKMKVYRLKDQR